MKVKLRLLVGLLTLVPFANAYADGAAAGHNLMANLARLHKALGVTEQTATVQPTLVHGMYRITKPNGELVGYTNEAGTIYGDGRNYTFIPTDGSELRALTPSEMSALRQEVLYNVSYDKLIKVTYGDGGNRAIIMNSALDCGFCQRYEMQLHASSTHVNTTFYVLPDILAHKGPAIAQQGWASVARIWCASDTSAAWKAYWASGSLPPEQGRCSYTAASARNESEVLRYLLNTVGIGLTGTPQFVREDGIVQHTADVVIGPQGRPPIAAVGSHWLASAN